MAGADARSGGRGDRGGRRSDTSDPQRSRERALKLLFQADLRGTDPLQTLAEMEDDGYARAMLDAVDDLTDATDHERMVARAADRPPAGSAEPIDGFTRSLVVGVAEHRGRIDELITRYARRWQIARMPVVDRTVLRLATHELLHEPTPPAVVIDQAVNLAKGLSTDDSGRYVNGVLESIRKDLAARASAAGTSAAGTSAAGTSAAGTSAAGTSAAGTSAAGTSAAGTSAAGTSAAGSAEVQPDDGRPGDV